jgi:cysteine synthase B
VPPIPIARWSFVPRIAAEIDGGEVVCVLADGGWKYLSTQAWSVDLDVAEKQVEETLWW